MNLHPLYAQLANNHHMMVDLLQSIPETDAYRRFADDVPPLAWLFGLAVYRETRALREWIQGNDDITARVRHLFESDLPDDTILEGMPPRDHLLNWALEVQEENLTRLANPKFLPQHPAVRDGRLAHHVLRESSILYERMLAALTERQIALQDDEYLVASPLIPALPSTAIVDMTQGHYRVGSQDDDHAAIDNELPTQVVQLSNFRIAINPVSNAEFLAFIADGGYQRGELWSDTHAMDRRLEAPRHWRRDGNGRWYGIGFNGPFDLLAGAPVTGINRFEAEAYANWISTQGDDFEGAVLQHEYQWEAATRIHAIQQTGIVWEWCSNPFHSYTDFQPSPDRFCLTERFDESEGVLRGGCMHSQPLLKRPSYRNHLAPDHRHHFAGIRLVFPPQGDSCGT